MTTDAAIASLLDPTKPDARCLRCGYDLRGHDVDGRCPECGLKAHWSLRAPILLSQYPAMWVVAMARGVKLLSVAYLVMFVMLILSVGGVLEGHQMLLMSTMVVAGVLQAAGAWLLAGSSHHWSEPRGMINRFVLRVMSLALILGAAGALWVAFDYRVVVAKASFFAMLASLLAPIAAFVRIRTVARMISDADLMEHATAVSAGFLASVVAGVALYIVMGFRGDATSTWVTVALFGVVIALLLFLLWGAFLMFCCIIDFSQAARIAMADWSNDEAPRANTAPLGPGAGVE